MKSVAIVGLGWLGFPLARYLQSLGWEVKGSKRTHEGAERMRLQRVESCYLELTPTINADPDDLEALLSVDSLIINIPPSEYFFDLNNYILSIENLLTEALLHNIQHIIFISSTSVYPMISGSFDENYMPTPTSDVGKALLEIEQRLWQLQDIDVDILRLAGLVGEDRHPVYHLSGKENIAGGNQTINLVHLTDCIRAIQLLLETPSYHRCYNLVTPIHLLKAEYYPKVAEKLGLPLPQFAEDSEPMERIILADKICQDLGFVYQYPDPELM
ncbi:NAD-dependent epimerase/dehydratase family protein [Gallibacterium trehalosifermentans]|uniref:NAD-dependent epimerase/dehydratase family protein n=1 Tax=Gallibacterium trehalosifermentans TaxID=516935 RepID=A0ABV6H147_9PAST